MRTEARENPWRQAVSEKLCKNNNFIVYLKDSDDLDSGFFRSMQCGELHLSGL